MTQSLMQYYSPGISQASQLTQNARAGKKINLDLYSRDEVAIISHALNEYIMHIWSHLGDTQFNRHGYRQATDLLDKKLAQHKQENDNASK